MTPSQFRKLPRGEQAFLIAADMYHWEQQAKAHKDARAEAQRSSRTIRAGRR